MNRALPQPSALRHASFLGGGDNHSKTTGHGNKDSRGSILGRLRSTDSVECVIKDAGGTCGRSFRNGHEAPLRYDWKLGMGKGQGFHCGSVQMS